MTKLLCCSFFNQAILAMPAFFTLKYYASAQKAARSVKKPGRL
jgi:hypothetical protein